MRLSFRAKYVNTLKARHLTQNKTKASVLSKPLGMAEASALAQLEAIRKREDKQRAAAEVARQVVRRYEIQVAAHHMAVTGETVWRQEVIPEEELFQCGFIHDFNKHRLLRLATKADTERREGPRFRDYGMDFLSRKVDDEGHVTYHAGQAKYRRGGFIGANDLGTFLNVVFARLRTTGYIYTTVPLEINLREDVPNTRGMLVHHRLALDAEPDGVQVVTTAAETTFALRPYQSQAVDALVAAEGRLALQLFCGGGKTLIAGHVLRRRDHAQHVALVVAIAPLKMSVDQLRTRLSPFLPQHTVLLVDSDEGGTTDLEEVRAAVHAGGKLAIFSTFKSAEAVLAQIDFGDDAFLLVDEVHNLVSNDALVAFTDGFRQTLMMSATLPEELFERMNVRRAFEFGMADAIREKHCCDYLVYLPLIQRAATGDVDVRIPELLAGDDPTLAAKALFLETACSCAATGGASPTWAAKPSATPSYRCWPRSWSATTAWASGAARSTVTSDARTGSGFCASSRRETTLHCECSPAFASWTRPSTSCAATASSWRTSERTPRTSAPCSACAEASGWTPRTRPRSTPCSCGPTSGARR